MCEKNKEVNQVNFNHSYPCVKKTKKLSKWTLTTLTHVSEITAVVASLEFKNPL